MERRALADLGLAVLEGDRALGQVLDARNSQVGPPRQVHLEAPGEERLRLATAGGSGRGLELLDERCRRALAEIEDRPCEERASTLPDRPPDDDRFGQPDAGRHTDDDAPVPAGACHLSQLVVERERAIVGEETPGEPGVASDEPVDAVEDDAGGSSLGAQGQGVDRRLGERGECGDARRRGRLPGLRRGGRLVPRPDVREVGRPEVDVRRVELVRLDREGRVTREGGPAIRCQPVGFGGSPGLDLGLVDREREIGRGAPRRAWGAREGHPSDPSISSFTSRLNSIAYSIGSSLVNTSRNPWTIRFWASFSVRPRLIR